jgi:cell wall-associated NlpC family hydrolase
MLALALLALPATAEGSQSSWAEADIALSTSHGLFAGTIATFQPNAPLTVGTLAQLVANLTGGTTADPTNPAQPVTVSRLDAALIDVLGLGSAAARFQTVAQAAGLSPPARFGTEVVARLLGLRTSHPASQPSLSLQPDQTATMAEAAFSAARILTLAPAPATSSSNTASTTTTTTQEAATQTTTPPTSTTATAALQPPTVALSAAAAAENGGGVAYVKQLAATFAIPTLTAWQQRVLATAVSLIGYPYFLGGDDEALSPGFDCSGFVWRVYKLAVYPGAPQLAATIVGRTAAAMAEQTPASERIGRADLEPGDVLFFGSGPHSTAAEIGHTAIDLGNGWLIQASNTGVSLGLLSWFGPQFAWARRPLAQAGLEADATSTAATVAGA